MNSFPELNTCTEAVIGLGYVGLPLAQEFAKNQPCLRTSEPLQRLEELRQGSDSTNETSQDAPKPLTQLEKEIGHGGSCS